MLNRMKAIIFSKYGPPEGLTYEDVARPVPQDDQVLVKIHAASMNAAEWHLVRGEPFPARFFVGGPFKPRKMILGSDMAGRVEMVGKNVTKFKPGDDVYGMLSGCGWGAFAEYVAVPENALAIKPSRIGFAAAAAMPMAALTALQGLRDKGHIQAGQKVLINGASGGVGTFAVQIAKAMGAEVTGVCSTRKMDMVRSIGADHVIDYTQENFTKSGREYDLILAANGFHPISDYKRALRPNGRYVMTGGEMAQMMQAMMLGPWISMTGSRKMVNSGAAANPKDLDFLSGLVDAGKITPVIDRSYPLHQAAEALAYVEQGHAIGKVVIAVV